ncbi:MAG: aminotransferase class V-fold PLP-dependent enzyme [Gemmatimonadota bacterium]
MTPDSALGSWFLPGSAMVHPEILRAMEQSVISSPRPETANLLARLRPPLQALFRTAGEVFITAGTATGLMEAAIRSGVEERVLVVSGGFWGDRFAEVARACGKDVVRVMVHPGRTIEPEHLLQFLDGPEVDAVALVHSETSTGALAPLAELVPVVRARKNLHVLVDAAGSIGGLPVETDLWGLDFVFASSHKALALPPGMALGVASPRFLERARKMPARGLMHDVAALTEDSRLDRGTPPPQAFALLQQLARIQAAGGVESRWRHHHELLTRVEEWVMLHPEVRLLAPEGRRSWTVSCLVLPGGHSANEIVAKMGEAGWMIATAHGELADRAILIGHMGEANVANLARLLDALGHVLGLPRTLHG